MDCLPCWGIIIILIIIIIILIIISDDFLSLRTSLSIGCQNFSLVIFSSRTMMCLP